MASYPFGKKIVVCFVFLVLAGGSKSVEAHWCSNIYNTFARIVVKPERQSIDVQRGATETLRVYVRNNLPYTLLRLELATDQPAGLSVSVDPSQHDTVYASKEVVFTLTISNPSGPDYSGTVTELNLRVRMEVEGWNSGEQGMSGRLVDPDPDPGTIRTDTAEDHQHKSLNWAALAELSCCEAEGVNELLRMWTIRNWPGYDSRGCRSVYTEQQTEHENFRAGLGLAILMRHAFDPTNSLRSSVDQSMIDAMNSNQELIRGTGAFFGAYGCTESSASVIARIEAMADGEPCPNTPCNDEQDPCYQRCDDPNDCGFVDSESIAQAMAQAALYLRGRNEYFGAVNACANRNSGLPLRVRAICAAALGIQGDDTPVEDVIIAEAPTGTGTRFSDKYGDYTRLYLSYLLQLVALDRRGGFDGQGTVSFYSEVPTDTIPPEAPTNLQARAP